MKFARILSLAVLLVLAAAVHTQDLTKFDRSIAKEPSYQSPPRYGLVVLGEAARTRIWLVLDGDTLYVDRNGNGDLTEAGEKVAAEKPTSPEHKARDFEIGDVVEGKFRHKEFKITRLSPNSGHVLVSLEVAERGIQTAGTDKEGSLEFSLTPKAAPVIHFNGPLRLNLTSKTPLSRNPKGSRLNACIGTPGVGPGSFAMLQYDDIPEDAHPRAEIRFDHSDKRATPIDRQFDLEHRC